MKIVLPEVPVSSAPRHDPATMSYRDAQTRPLATDRGEFAFREHKEKPDRPPKPRAPLRGV